MDKGCIFCNLESSKVVFENKYAKAFFDAFPVNEGHMLVVPKKHNENYFQLTSREITAIHSLLHECERFLKREYKATGFNIGWNCGRDAGQTVFHAHCHIIPRVKGDVVNPKGGIRNFKESLKKY